MKSLLFHTIVFHIVLFVSVRTDAAYEPFPSYFTALQYYLLHAEMSAPQWRIGLRLDDRDHGREVITEEEILYIPWKSVHFSYKGTQHFSSREGALFPPHFLYLYKPLSEWTVTAGIGYSRTEIRNQSYSIAGHISDAIGELKKFDLDTCATVDITARNHSVSHVHIDGVYTGNRDLVYGIAGSFLFEYIKGFIYKEMYSCRPKTFVNEVIHAVEYYDMHDNAYRWGYTVTPYVFHRAFLEPDIALLGKCTWEFNKMHSSMGYRSDLGHYITGDQVSYHYTALDDYTHTITVSLDLGTAMEKNTIYRYDNFGGNALDLKLDYLHLFTGFDLYCLRRNRVNLWENSLWGETKNRYNAYGVLGGVSTAWSVAILKHVYIKNYQEYTARIWFDYHYDFLISSDIGVWWKIRSLVIDCSVHVPFYTRYGIENGFSPFSETREDPYRLMIRFLL